MDFRSNLDANLTVEGIRCVLAQLGETNKPSRKDDLVERLHAIWLHEPKRLINELLDPERLLLADCAHNDSSFPDVAMLNAKYGFSYRIPYDWCYKDCHIVLCFLCRDGHWGHELVEGVSETLKTLLPVPPPLEIASAKTLPDEGCWTFARWGGKEEHLRRALRLHESACIAPQEARRMLQLAGAGRLRVSDKSGYPTLATQKLVRDALYATDLDLVLPDDQPRPLRETDIDPGPIRAFAWPVLLQQCGWTKVTAGKLKLTRKGKALLDDFGFERYAEGIQRLVKDTAFDELKRVTVLKGQRSKRAGRSRIPPPHRRSAAFESLRILPTDEWVAIEEAHRILYALGEDGRAYADGMCLYIDELKYGHLAGRESDIGRIYFRQFVGESLATLGLVDLGYAYPHYLHPELHGSWGLDDTVYVTRYDGLEYLRVTPLGRFCLGVEESYTPPESDQRALFKVLPNHEIVVTDNAEFSTADAAMLERFADRKSDAVWRMDSKTILRALESGDTPADIIRTLQGGSDVEIPATVTSLLETTAARANAAVDRKDAVIISFRDEETAVLVAHDTAAAKSVLCRHDRAVVVRKSRIKSFQTALRKLGILLP